MTLRYGLCVAAVGVALALSALLWPFTAPTPSLLFFPAVVIVALYGGLGPGLAATVASVASIAFFLLPPYYSFKAQPIDALRLLVFGASAAIVSSLAAGRRQAEEALRHLMEDLERRIAERTAELERTHRALEASQRLEGIGHLAGGIAHDFSNLLTVIIGNVDVLADTLPESSPERCAVGEIRTSAERGARLTRQLLAYARRQPLHLEALAVNELVTDIVPLVRHISPETVSVTTVLAPGLPQIQADRSQLEQMLMNVCINGCEAMPAGGALTIRTRYECLPESACGDHPDLVSGTYVVIEVQDTGVGMDSDTARHAIEPFFTTKPVGQGTGLGLSTAYGIVRQLRGDLRLETARGEGTSVVVRLPAISGSTSIRADCTIGS